jgi:hypothetical protein
MSFPVQSPERSSLVPVIAMLLQFNVRELAQAENALKEPIWSQRPVKEIKRALQKASASPYAIPSSSSSGTAAGAGYNMGMGIAESKDIKVETSSSPSSSSSGAVGRGSGRDSDRGSARVGESGDKVDSSNNNSNDSGHSGESIGTMGAVAAGMPRPFDEQSPNPNPSRSL